MKIKTIRFQNLHSLRGTHAIEFEKMPLAGAGLFAITGDTGAGKSTILDAVTLALFGQTPRQDKKGAKEVLSHGTPECYAEVDFEAKGYLLRARWSLRRAYGKTDGNLQSPKRELSKYVAELDEWQILEEYASKIDQAVETYCGLDFDRFTRSVLLAQGAFAAFLQAKTKERSDLLERITGTDIYSQIGTAAFERHQLEEEKLQGIHQQQEALQLLQPEELQAIDQQQTELQEIREAQTKHIKQLEQQLQKWEFVEQLQEEQQVAQATLQNAENALEQAQSEQRRLELHRQSLPLQADLLQYQQERNVHQQLESQIDVLRNKIDRDLQHIRQGQADIQALQGKRDEANTTLQEKKPLIQKVKVLDTRIEEKKAPLHQINKDLEEQLQSMHSLSDKQGRVLEKMQSDQKVEKALDQWLDQHQYLKSLPKEIRGIELRLEGITSYEEQQKKVKKIITEEKKNIDDLSKSRIKTEKQLQKEQQRRNELQKTFEQANPLPLAHPVEAVIEQIDQRLKEIHQSIEGMEKIDRHYERYQQILQDIEETEEELSNLRIEDQHLFQSFLALDLPMQKALEAEREARRLYDREQKMLNLSTMRSELEEGEACPLCLSTHHPFRETNIEVEVDTFARRLKQAEKRREKLRTQMSNLLARQDAVHSQIQKIESLDESGPASGKLPKLQQQMLACEAKLAEAMGWMPKQTPFSGKHFKSHYQQLLKQRSTYSEQQEILKKIGKQITEKEKRIGDLNHQKDQLVGEIRANTKVLQRDKESLHALQKKQAEEVQALQALLQPFDLAYEVEQADALLQRLRTWNTQLEEKTDQLQKIRKSLQELEKQHSADQSQLEALQKQTNTLKKRRDAMEEERASLQQKRKALFGDDQPDQLLAALESQKEEALQALEEKQQALQATTIQKERNEANLEQTQQQLATTQASNQKRLHRLQENAQSRGFDSWQSAQEALLPEEEAKTLEQQLNQLKESRLKAAERLKDLKQRLEKSKASLPEDLDVETLKTNLAAKQTEQAKTIETLANLKATLDQNQKRQKQNAALLKEGVKQQKEVNRWAKLKELIGSKDGNKYRTFAQSLTLRRLIQMANAHLRQLNGRYLIELTEEGELELDIVDTFQADNRRSMATLSGGEGFLVSLALALGLSDLAGRNALIQSLFIDEGFGTLDSHSLDLAISTLDNLQAFGKTIGIISHVPELKERIGVQIQVQKLGNGVSSLEVVG